MISSRWDNRCTIVICAIFWSNFGTFCSMIPERCHNKWTGSQTKYMQILCVQWLRFRFTMWRDFGRPIASHATEMLSHPIPSHRRCPTTKILSHSVPQKVNILNIVYKRKLFTSILVCQFLGLKIVYFTWIQYDMVLFSLRWGNNHIFSEPQYFCHRLMTTSCLHTYIHSLFTLQPYKYSSAQWLNEIWVSQI